MQEARWLRYQNEKYKKKSQYEHPWWQKEILNDARRVTQIIPIKDIQTLLITIDEIYDFQTATYKIGSAPPSTTVYKHENVCEMELLVKAFSETNSLRPTSASLEP